MFMLALSLLCACGSTTDTEAEKKWNENGADPFAFDGNMINSEAKIDGLDDDELWQSENKVVVEFGDAKVTIVRKPQAIYLFYKVHDTTNYRYVSSGAAEEVTHSDSVEFYFDAKLSRTDKPAAGDYQINLGRDSRTRICAGAGWIKWMAMYMFEVREGGVMTGDEDYYCVEAMLPLAQMGIGEDQAVGMAFGQVNRYVDVNFDREAYFSWNGLTFNGNFVDPQIPSTYVVLTGDGSQLLSYDEYQKTLGN